MLDFKFRRRSLWALGPAAAAPFLLGGLALTYKGAVVDHLARGSAQREALLCVAAFAAIQILITFINTLRANSVRLLAVAEFERAWTHFFPERIGRARAAKGDAFYTAVFGHVPQLFELEAGIHMSLGAAAATYALFLYKVVADRFWPGLLCLLAINVLSLAASRLWATRYAQGVRDVARARLDLLSWTGEFFRASREVGSNWDAGSVRSWYAATGERTGATIRAHGWTAMRRELVGSALVDWPYILCLAVILAACAAGRLTLGQSVVWMGMIDFIVEGNRSWRAYLDQKLRLSATREVAAGELAWTRQASAQQKTAEHDTEGSYVFQLLDGSPVRLALSPGLYTLAGGNGSGKSTLLDTVIGFNAEYSRWAEADVLALRRALSGRVRVIEREPVVFSLWSGLSRQVFGPSYKEENSTSLRAALSARLKELCGVDLANAWLGRLALLKERAAQRGTLEFSSGEKVVLSVLRAAASWDKDVKALVVDECEQALDSTTRALFLDTVNAIARSYAVYLVSHNQATHAHLSAAPRPSLMTSLFLLAYDEQGAGHAICLSLSARSGGSGKVTGLGNVGRALADQLTVAKTALQHQLPGLTELDGFDYVLEADKPGFTVGHASSAGLALAAGLLNISRASRGQGVIEGVAATGKILLDGSIEAVAGLEAKRAAAHACPGVKKLILPDTVRDVRGLARAMLA